MSEDTKLIMKEIHGLKTEIQAVREELGSEINAVREELGSEIKAVREELGSEINAVREELGSEINAVREELGSEINDVREKLESEIQDVREDVNSIQLTLENVTNRNISIIGEGHLNLSRRLDEALKVENEKELLLVRVNILENDVRLLKEQMGQTA